MAKDAADIFVSYRRSSLGTVQRICARLGETFEGIYLDVKTIRPGAVFPDSIKDGVANAKVVLVFMGKGWVSEQDPDTMTQRLRLRSDWVRRELEIALSSSCTIIPVLIEGAEPPKPRQLPTPLAELCNRQRLAISDDAFDADVAKLIDAIKTRLKKPEPAHGSLYPHGKPAVKPSPLTEEETQNLLTALPHWSLQASPVEDDQHPEVTEKIELVRDFHFNSFMDAIEFMRQVAPTIDDLNHHPRWENIFKTVRVALSTWDIGHRPTQLDYLAARMLERCYERFIADEKSSKN